jgi:hypothetical protein
MTLQPDVEEPEPRVMQLTQELLEKRDGCSLVTRLQILGRHIANDSNQREFVEYRVRVSRGDDLWDVHRRYSHFRALNKKLKAEAKAMNLEVTWPRFPARFTRGILDPTSKVFLDRRQAQLQKYLWDVLEIPEVEKSAALVRFLKLTAIDETLSRSALSLRSKQFDSFPVMPNAERLEDFLPER